MSRNNAGFDVFEDEEKVSSPKKKVVPPAATISPEKRRLPSPLKKVQKPSPPPPPAAAVAVTQPTALPKHPDDLISKEARERASEAEKQNRETHDMVCRTNRILSEAVENLAKVKTAEKAELFEAMRDLRVLTEAAASGCTATQKLAENLLTTVSQQQQAIERLLEARVPVTTTGRVRAPAPEVTAPKGLGLDNESKADKAKRQKKEKEEAAAAAKKNDDAEEKQSSTAGEKRKADASPEREKKHTVTSKLKGDQPQEKKPRMASAPKKKPAQQKKTKPADSDAESASSDAESDDEKYATPKKKSSRSESPAMTQAQPMDD